MSQPSSLYSAHMPPIDFELIQICPFQPTWNPALQLIFVSEGWINLQISGTPVRLQEKQLAILSPMEIYSAPAGVGVAAVFQIDVAAVCQHCPEFHLPPLQTLIPPADQDSYSRQIRELLADVIRMSDSEPRRTLSLDYLVNGIKLLSLLADCCAQENAHSNVSSQSLPLLKAIFFTTEHFREPISVKEAAAVAQFSPPYFSKLFSSFMGMSFTEYLTELRLQEGEQMLQRGISIAKIAESCGFSDHRAFSRAYRKKHNKNASQARSALAKESAGPASSTPISASVSQHLTTCMDNLSTDSQLPIRFKLTTIPDVSLSGSHRNFPHTWQKSIGVGRACHIRYATNQEMLRTLQEQIGYQRAVLHSLLDDDMQVLYVDERGVLSYYFGNVDTVLDFLLSIRLKPVIQLGFMPSLLTRHRSQSLYENRSLVSLPNDLSAWKNLIRTLIQHLFQRYGHAEVEDWEFCLWSKPDSSPLPFGFPNVEEYFNFYLATYQTVKGCSSNIQFGSPAFLADSIGQDQWLSRFLSLCREHSCMPDTIRFDFYPIVLPAGSYNIGSYERVQHHGSASSMQTFLLETASYCKKHKLPFQQPELEEWNFSISQRELINDTCYKAVYIVKNVLECWDKSSDLTYWGFSDTLDETLLTNELFHGGLGLFAKGQLRKPAYYAFLLLSRLGNRIVTQGDGYIVTTRRQSVQVLFYNYCHYSSLYANGDTFHLSFSNRYAPFVEQRRNRFSVLLTNLPATQYLIISHRLNREHGSVFDNWVNMGMEPLSSQEEYDYLQGRSQPLMNKRRVTLPDHTLQLTPELEPFEIMLFEIQPTPDWNAPLA